MKQKVQLEYVFLLGKLLICFLFFIISACATTNKQTGFRYIEGQPGVKFKNRGPEFIFLKDNQTHYFNNRWGNCVAFTLDGEWGFSNKDDALQQFVDTHYNFVGVAIFNTLTQPGPDPVSRALTYFQKTDKKQHGQTVQGIVEPFPTSINGSYVLYYEKIPLDQTTLNPELVDIAKKKLDAYEDQDIKLYKEIETRVIIPYFKDSIIVITVSKLAYAKEVVRSLKTLTEEETRIKIQDNQKNNKPLLCWDLDIIEKSVFKRGEPTEVKQNGNR